MSSRVKTAVFPVAGMGTRFLPITKAIPKEMLTILDRPLIQYAVEEALSAGINKLIFVTAGGKRAIEDYFDINYELESRLEKAGKTDALASVRSVLPNDITFCYVRQKAPKGLGDAILTAKQLVGDEPFAVLLADDLMVGRTMPVLKQMVTHYQEDPSQALLALETVPPQDTDKYGIATCDGADRLTSIIEKPQPEHTPSRLAVVGRYILPATIFSLLEKTPLGYGGELQLTDAIAALLNDAPVRGYRYQGLRFDCGSPQGYLRAVIHFSRQDPQLSQVLSAELNETVN